MIYTGSFKDIIYPSTSREPQVARYRILLARHRRAVRAIVHLIHEEPIQPAQPNLVTALDVVLNRIVSEELVGVRLDRIQFVVESGTDVVEYPIKYNALEYAHPRRTGKSPVGSKDEAIHIRSRDVIGGSVAVYADQHEAQPVAPGIVKILR
ncbi:hypothetical protein [Paraburkholderia terrae]|uniref:hypothetical protein n=1 Tax=Paraburkholderia terrae TaxID=311230 RepID=UPI00206CC1FE|nr:hypothetical protein [Paraburkholderia terrae]BDC45425.1 hypothetical protein PTKU15_87220 [Paraburkholderia terrae]